MDTNSIITISSIVLVNITALIISYNKTTSWVKVKLKELDMKIHSLKCDYEKHVEWGQNQQESNVSRFNYIETENKQDHKEMIGKMDTIITQLNQFMLEVLSKIKN